MKMTLAVDSCICASRLLLKGILLALWLLIVPSGVAFAQSSPEKEARPVVFPQPAAGMVRIAFPHASAELPEIAVFDLLGKPLSHLQAERESATVFIVDMTDEKSGLYFLKVKWGRETYSRRITILPGN